MEISNPKTKNGILKCGPRDLESLYTRPTSSHHGSSSSSSTAGADGSEGGGGGGGGGGSGGGSGGGGGGGTAKGKKPKGRTGWPQHVWAQELKPEQAEVRHE